MGFDPATLMAAGAIAGAYGEYQAGEEANAVAKYNQQVKEREAEAVEQQTKIKSMKAARQAKEKYSRLLAQGGMTGAISSEGAILEVLSTQAQESEQESLDIGYEGILKASQLREEGEAIREEGRSKRRASRYQAGATLLTGFGGAYAVA